MNPRAKSPLLFLAILLASVLAPSARGQAYLIANKAEREEFKGQASISGRLAWSGGAPAANEKIDVVAIPPGAGALKIAEIATDADGRYRVEGIAGKKARYRLYLTKDETQRTFYIFVPKEDSKIEYDYTFQPRVGDPAPPHVMPGLDGKPVDLASFRGQVVVVKFWAVWCGTCHEEMARAAELLRARKDWAGRVAFLAVNCDPDRKTLDAFVAEKRLEGMIQMHEPGKKLEGARSRGFRVDSLPFTFVIDRAGNVRLRGARVEKLEEEIDKLLKEEAKP